MLQYRLYEFNNKFKITLGLNIFCIKKSIVFENIIVYDQLHYIPSQLLTLLNSNKSLFILTIARTRILNSNIPYIISHNDFALCLLILTVRNLIQIKKYNTEINYFKQ